MKMETNTRAYLTGHNASRERITNVLNYWIMNEYETYFFASYARLQFIEFKKIMEITVEIDEIDENASKNAYSFNLIENGKIGM